MRVMSEEKLQKLASFIDQYARDNNGESPSLSDIMDYMGMVKSTAYRHVVELEKRGIISYKRIARNIYADSEEECEVKLEALIREMKAEFGIR